MRTKTADTYQNTNTKAGSVTLIQYSTFPFCCGIVYVAFFSKSMSVLEFQAECLNYLFKEQFLDCSVISENHKMSQCQGHGCDSGATPQC